MTNHQKLSKLSNCTGCHSCVTNEHTHGNRQKIDSNTLGRRKRSTEVNI